MQIEGQRPSRVAIQTFEGDDAEEIQLLNGMTHKLYGAVYVNTAKGERVMGDASDSELLTDVEYEILNETSLSPISINKDGCVEAKALGTAFVKLKGFSLSKGMLTAMSQVTVQSAQSLQARVLKSNVLDWSVSKLQGKDSVYGLTLGNQFFTLEIDAQNSAALQPSGENILENQAPLNNISVGSDLLGQGFYAGYSTQDEGQDYVGYSVFNKLGERLGSFDSLKDTKIIMKKTYIFQTADAIPMALAVGQNTKKDDKGNRVLDSTLSFFLYKNNLGRCTNASDCIQEGFVSDSKTSEIIEIDAASDLDSVIDVVSDAFGTAYIVLGTRVEYPDKDDADKRENPNRMKVISINHAQGVQTWDLNLEKLASSKAFSVDASYDLAKIVYINDKNELKFVGHLQPQVVDISKKIAANVDGSLKPVLHASQEDGSLTVVWRDKSADMKVSMSQDGGKTWHAAQDIISETVSKMNVFSLPCGGAMFFMTDTNSTLKGFLLQKDKVQAMGPQLAIGVNDFKVFRDHGRVRLFYLNNGKQVGMISIP
ncbi:MAG: hypothetical protein A3B70_04655 [Deltaproteobacteria bacterium RIFCSPHIGHO2_02_FULL_40_11]|nr:MAG: hypothetical protein A3B70_04655 [Deltaproteobacteria bacterium RIFCSPHIGHO2_02_FULL_40_11]